MKIGDRVVLVNIGMVYTNYLSKFIECRFKDLEFNPKGVSLDKLVYQEFTIFSTTTHEDFPHKPILGIENSDGVQLLVSYDGLRLKQP
jgi:hypothetical protein